MARLAKINAAKTEDKAKFVVQLEVGVVDADMIADVSAMLGESVVVRLERPQEELDFEQAAREADVRSFNRAAGGAH